MANSRHYDPLSLYMPQLCKDTWLGKSGAIGESIQQGLLQSHVDYHSVGCRFLDGNEDKKEMVERPGINSFHGTLFDRSRAGGREGPEGQGYAYGRPSACFLEQDNDAISQNSRHCIEATLDPLSTPSNTYTQTQQLGI